MLPSLERSAEERRAFEFYFRKAAPGISGVVDMAFWRGIVLQLGQTQPAIWDAIITIGTLYENPQYRNNAHTHSNLIDQSTVDDTHRRALRWYARSLSNVREQLQRGAVDLHVSLITCLLYIGIETMQGHIKEGYQLYDQGVKLVSQIHARNQSSNANEFGFLGDVTLPVFVRMGIVSSIMTGLSLGIKSESGFVTDEQYHFDSVYDAYMSLHKLVLHCTTFAEGAFMRLLRSDEEDTSKRVAQILLHSRLDDWRRAYQRLDDAQGLSRSTEYKGLAALFRMSWACASIIVRTAISKEQSIYDQHMDLFEEMVQDGALNLTATATADGSQPGFTFEMGVGLPLFFVAIKCRQPRLRREAIRLLQQAPPMQGLFKSARAVYLASKAVELEEDRPFTLDLAAEDDQQLPDESRRVEILLAVGDPLPKDRIWFLRSHWDSERGGWRLVEESIELEE
jgi:AcrR family transcriptional regulator